MGIERIESTDDPRLDAFREVTDPRRIREQGTFVAEGRRVVADLLTFAPHLLRHLCLTEAALATFERQGVVWPDGLDVRVVASPASLLAMTGVRFHQGCLGVADLPASLSVEALLGTSTRGLLLVLEGVTDPDNVGTLFRSARAFGADAVVLAAGAAHPLYRKALRTSLGNTLRLPFVFDPAWPEALDVVGDAGFARVALTPDPTAEPLQEVVERIGSRAVAVMLGSEAEGLTEGAFARSDARARIPLRSEVDSLNVAAAGAIALAAFGRLG